jgi:lipopolysaccharide export system ATP-binding protein
VNLHVGRGEILGIFGPSGAGKSTLFRALAGEERPGAGRVRLDGRDVTNEPLWRRARSGLGYVPQVPSVLWDLSVDENLDVVARLTGRPRRPELRVALGLDHRANVPAGSLSGGERRRLEVARALSAAPQVLLCDEPFAALDPDGASRVASQLALAAKAGMSVVIADHHVARALELCDRAVLLLDGEVGIAATPSEFKVSDVVRKHYVTL